MKAIALLAIKAYQRYISPHKGFCCAYRAHTGRRSCSALGYRAIRRYGVLPGIAVLRQRFQRCSAAYQQRLAVRGQQAMNPWTLACARLALRPRQHRRLRHGSQQGFCDCDCPSIDMPCDAPSGKSAQGFCDFLDCCNSCDCGNWQRTRKNTEETPPYLAPRRWWKAQRLRPDRLLKSDTGRQSKHHGRRQL